MSGQYPDNVRIKYGHAQDNVRIKSSQGQAEDSGLRIQEKSLNSARQSGQAKPDRARARPKTSSSYSNRLRARTSSG